MDKQLVFIIVIVFVLIYYLPSKKHINNKSSQQVSQSTNQQPISQSTTQQPTTQSTTQSTSQQEISQPTIQQVTQNVNNSMNVINEYLNVNECKENFNTMGKNVNIGNNMNFKQNFIQTEPKLVPDFELDGSNVKSKLNSFGYETINEQSDNYYKSRGFIEPNEGQKYADDIAYTLSHPFQTRYCKN